MSTVSFSSTDPARSPSSTTSYVPRRTSTPMVLCVTFSVAAIVALLMFSKGCLPGCSATDAPCWRRSSMSAGDEPFAVEHRGHDAPGEQVKGQQGSGDTERERGRHGDHVQRHQGDDDQRRD